MNAQRAKPAKMSRHAGKAFSYSNLGGFFLCAACFLRVLCVSRRGGEKDLERRARFGGCHEMFSDEERTIAELPETHEILRGAQTAFADRDDLLRHPGDQFFRRMHVDLEGPEVSIV